MMAKFEITKRKNGEFQFNLKAGNGEIILTSEGYKAKDSCKNGIESVKKNSQIDERFEKLTAKNGKPYFTLKASNGQVIGMSEMYAAESGRANGIASVKKNAPDAEVVDLSDK
ncbi:YegP family protein [Parabacteroides sp. PF5-9]|uniref:YegP family protein n=1 Tax=Parabacteroides sp. PF5-9 TaxID=1742404 RepID=UPI0032AE8D91